MLSKYSIKLFTLSIVCDEHEVMIVAFEATIGWSVHVYLSSSNLKHKQNKQCLYRVDKNDFPWTQFIGNCALSSRFLIITPTTAEHEIHLWRRQMKNHDLSGTPMIIKQQMSDRYANLTRDYYALLYRNNLFTLYNVEKEVKTCWTYSVYAGEYAERVIMKVVCIDLEKGILVWEKDILEKHSLHLRSLKNKLLFKTNLEPLETRPQRVNDIIQCGRNMVILDLTDKFGNGLLDMYDYRQGRVLKRFQHPHKPQHGWVVHCRSVAPPRWMPALHLVPFIQYSLCLDLKLAQVSLKNSDNEGDKRPWPVHVESVAYNSHHIFYTDVENRNVIHIISAV